MHLRILAYLLLCSAITGESAAADLSPSRQTALRNLVQQDCGSCHGLTLKGGLGKPLLPQSLAALSDEAVADIILGGIDGTPMPAWRGLVDDTDALWIARALKEGLVR